MREITNEIKAEIKDMIFDYYAEECEVDKASINDNTNLQDDLESDSLMLVELIEMTADKFDLDIKLQSIGKYMLKTGGSGFCRAFFVWGSHYSLDGPDF